MGFHCGIVGLPNVGKSTLFNALTETAAAQAANYPFCTIEPNVGRVALLDPRLDALAAIAGSARIIPTFIEAVDIAGLVRGASRGEGLGNQFLGHIRSVDAIIHMVRCFVNTDITHVEGSIDPLRDIAIINTELLLADLESIEKRLPVVQKKLKSGNDPELKQQVALMEQALAHLQEGQPARLVKRSADDEKAWQQLQLITAKPVVYVCNVNESDAASGNGLTTQVAAAAQAESAVALVVSAAIEAELASLESAEERRDFLASIGLAESGLSRVARAGHALLGLMTFFTVGPKEARAWTTLQGSKAPQAAGVIHSDFERGFICAETIAYDDYVAHRGEQGAKTAGKLRLEGRDYVVQDGDVIHFRFNV